VIVLWGRRLLDAPYADCNGKSGLGNPGAFRDDGHWEVGNGIRSLALLLLFTQDEKTDVLGNTGEHSDQLLNVGKV